MIAGWGLVETLVASLVAFVVVGTAGIVFTKNQSFLRDENDSANIRAQGRQAIKLLAEEIRMAGFGLPPAQGITAISANSISFRTNQTGIQTTTDQSPGVTTGGTAGDSTIAVADETDFNTGDKILIYDPFNNTFEPPNTVTGTAAGSLTLGTVLANSYPYGFVSRLVTINKYNDVVIAFADSNITRTVDGTAIPLVSDVTGLSFNYNGAAAPAAVLTVGITLNLVDPNNPNASIEFKTDVNLRNS